jgi:hypothetical protein
MGPACCARALRTGVNTWCVLGSEPSTQHRRIATVNLLTLTTTGAAE